MEKPWSPYINLIVETYYDRHAQSIRVRPILGEAFPQTMNVECSRSMQNPIQEVGTRFRIRAKQTDKEGGTPFLYCHYDWPFVVVKRGAD